MHKTALAALAALGATLGLASTAHAQPPESWVYVGMQGGAMGWDAGAIKRDAEAGTAATQRFFYFAKPRQSEKSDFTWVFQDIEFDCRASTFTLMEGVFFNKARGSRKGEPAPEGAIPVRANTPESVLQQVLCNDAVLREALPASSMADAMDGAEKAALPVG